MKRHFLAMSVILFAAVAVSAPPAAETTAIYVELENPRPVVVERWHAERAGEALDEAAHRAAIRAAQDAFLQRVADASIPFMLSQTGWVTPARTIEIEDRFSELINAVRLELAGADVIRLRGFDNVRHVSLDTPRFISLDNSVAYIRANGTDSARSAGNRGDGSPNGDGTGSGQIIAYLDTGIDHSHPMFDTTVDDAQFQNRLGDTRLPRLGGETYVDGTHHPKVVYRAEFSGQPILGDDNGHGTQGASCAAGLKAMAPTGEILEGVAPGALLMDYKVCPSLTCDSSLILQSLEDAVRPVDIEGNPKPVATVVNLSLGSCDGDPYAADSVAAGNLQYAGAVPFAAAGNLDLLRETLCDDHIENTLDSPGAGRLVVAVGASIDPGDAAGESNLIDILQPNQPLRDGQIVTDPGALPVEPGQPSLVATHAPESLPILAPGAQYYVDVGFADTPDDVPAAVAGRICLSERGGDIDAGAAGSGLYANKASQCAARGGTALVVFNNVPGEIGAVLAPAAIPVLTVSRKDGLYLRDTLGFEGADFGAISNFPIRFNLATPRTFEPALASFSARGPNNDFAVVKPDILGPGQNVFMATALAGDPSRYTSASGTSFSTPHMAGAAALVRDPVVGRPDFSPSMVRAALMNSATNLRRDDAVTPVADDDERVFLHETGAGLVEMVRATTVGTLMGTNELNGTGGPDDPADPDFLPSYSFGELDLIGTGLDASMPSQRRTVSVTVADVGGGGGTFDLGIVDAGRLRGDITRPVDVDGFSVALGATSVTVPAGGSAVFDVAIAIDGTESGLQIAGADDDGLEGTDIAWYVTATGSGGESLRMPFYARGARGAGDLPPVARADSAITTKDQAVDVVVLANDSDPEGQPLSVSSLSQPANGTATLSADDSIRYEPAAGFLGEDSFTYTVSDGANDATASVTVLVFECEPTTGGEFFDDFEPGAEPGWTVDTAILEAAAGVPWTLAPDPFTESPVNAWFSEAANAAGLKDDRLIAPPQDLTADSRLVFWQRFSLETGYDGGVLEVSTDGGTSWTDVVAGGGVFVEGGYNGVISPDDQSPIAGRDAWTGFSEFINAMSRVEVDLGVYAGLDVLVRWRLAQDPVFGDQGWWVDDVHFTGLLDEPDDCNLGPDAVDDHAVTDRDQAVTIEVLANDSDPENDPLTVTSVTQPANGNATVNADSTVTYTPDPGFVGEDTFDYTASDGREEDDATVTVEVRAPALPGKTTGGGAIADGGDEGKFAFNAQRQGAESWGHLNYRATASGLRIDGDVTEVSVAAFEADFSGTCTLEDGNACEFSVHVEDAAEPGKGVDRFSIRITTPAGDTLHEGEGLLTKGNIQVHD